MVNQGTDIRPRAGRDFFDLFGLKPKFKLDPEDLSKRYRLLQQKFHPDRFSGATAPEQRIAAQLSAEVNTAYQTLLDPVNRAGYMLERLGYDRRDLQRQPASGDFLFRQMELRETVQSLASDDAAGHLALLREVDQLIDSELDTFQRQLDAGDSEAAGVAWVHLLYLKKLRRELDAHQNR